MATRIISFQREEKLDVPAVANRAAREVDYLVERLHFAAAIAE